VNPSAVLGEAWALYKSQWRHLLPLAFVVYLLLSLLVLLLTVTLDWVGAVAGALVSIVGTFWIQGALVVAVQDVRDGRADLTIGETLSRVQPKINKLTLAGLLAGIGILIGFLLLIVPGLILLTWWLFIVPVIMLEDAGIMESFGRSRELVRGNGWNVFGLIVMTILILIVAQIVLSLILSPLDDDVQGYVGSLISNTLLTPFVAAAWTIGYFHLRDVESAAAAVAAPSEPV
jgi:hypothetical protein